MGSQESCCLPILQKQHIYAVQQHKQQQCPAVGQKQQQCTVVGQKQQQCCGKQPVSELDEPKHKQFSAQQQQKHCLYNAQQLNITQQRLLEAPQSSGQSKAEQVFAGKEAQVADRLNSSGKRLFTKRRSKAFFISGMFCPPPTLPPLPPPQAAIVNDFFLS